MKGSIRSRGRLAVRILLWASVVLLASMVFARARAQSSPAEPAPRDPLQRGNQALRQATGARFGFTFEERTRWEEKTGVNFGRAVDQQDMLGRLRIGAWYQPAEWLRVSAMGQDARIPFYGVPAPNSVRDTLDLQEARVELFTARREGFSAAFGRAMLDYGEGRVIGTPQWSNVARTFDHLRLFYRTGRARFEVLLVSPVKVRPDGFNRPELGDRIWGTYNAFTGVARGASLDIFALRHSQNRIGGWGGAGTLGTNSFGGRFYGKLPLSFAYSVEGIGQTGHLGPARQRAWAGFAGASREMAVARRKLRLSAEYKTASRTYDQLSPANHDKFGHLDLFGWRNIRTVKSLETLDLTGSLAVNVMYTNHWLASAADPLYNGQGSAIVQSRSGTAGRHVGQEADAFLTWRHGAHLFAAGFGHFFKGEFIVQTTPHVNSRYLYIFQQYTLK